jgi:hypothetical protein
MRAMRAVGLGPGSPHARRLAATRESRRLRRLVAQLHGCLAALDPRARRLLNLRAGLHGRARSAQATARILHISLRREAIRERRALGALTRGAATGCAGRSADVPTAAATGNLPALSATPPSGLTPAPGRHASESVSRASYSSNRPGSGNANSPSSRSRTEQAETSGSFPSALLTALLGLLLALAMVIVPKHRRPASAPAGVDASSNGVRVTEATAATAAAGEPRTQVSEARQPITQVVPPTDPAIAPMAADAFTRMAGDGVAAPDASGSGEAASPDASGSGEAADSDETEGAGPAV